MEVILTDSGGYQLQTLLLCNLDIDLNGEKNFELSMSSSEYDPMLAMGGRIFVPGTEIGGIIGGVVIDSGLGTISYTGDTWRGRLSKKIILPPEGQDYFIVSGELHSILKKIIEARFGGVFRVSEALTGVDVTYQFPRFCSVYEGIKGMLATVGYRLDLSYNMGMPNSYGWVDIQAVPIKDYSEEIELSQDSQLTFVTEKKCDGVNHLIVGGKGELQERIVLHLYVQEDGSIGKTQYYFGLQEIEEFYENTAAETEELEKSGIEHLEERKNYKTFTMDVETLGIDVAIGDIIGGRDYITGESLAEPLENVIVTMQNGEISKEYKLGGGEQ